MSSVSPRFGEIAIKHGTTIQDVRQAANKQWAIQERRGKHRLLGDIMVEDGTIPEANRQLIVRELAMYPRVPYPPDTFFGKSLREYVKHKQAVGLRIAGDRTLIPDGADLFLADGSHNYYLLLALIREKRPVSIATNNMGVAGEYTIRRGEITRLDVPSKGTADTEYGGLFDLDEDKLKRAFAGRLVFISAPALDPAKGPCAPQPAALVRRMAIQHAPQLVVLCDYDNLCKPAEEHAPVLQGAEQQDWQKRLSETRTWVITTSHPDMPTGEFRSFPDKRTPHTNARPGSWQHYSQNARTLYNLIGDKRKFIEVDGAGLGVR